MSSWCLEGDWKESGKDLEGVWKGSGRGLEGVWNRGQHCQKFWYHVSPDFYLPFHMTCRYSKNIMLETEFSSNGSNIIG